jgi:alpha-D-ribose 1-methylphosphonate 5-triphosphate synthase subunit PhnL
MEILSVRDLGKSFYLHEPGLEIRSCQNISFTLGQGEFIGIVGLSGAGKSTILKCINRSYLPMQGEILYDSEG